MSSSIENAMRYINSEASNGQEVLVWYFLKNIDDFTLQIYRENGGDIQEEPIWEIAVKYGESYAAHVSSEENHVAFSVSPEEEACYDLDGMNIIL